MLPLEDTGRAEEIRSGASGSGGAFAAPAHCRGVVTHGGDGAFPAVSFCYNDGLLAHSSGQLEVRVCEGAVGVVIGKHLALEFDGERPAPDDWVAAVVQGVGFVR